MTNVLFSPILVDYISKNTDFLMYLFCIAGIISNLYFKFNLCEKNINNKYKIYNNILSLNNDLLMIHCNKT